MYREPNIYHMTKNVTLYVDASSMALNRKTVEGVIQGLEVGDDVVDFMSFYQRYWK